MQKSWLRAVRWLFACAVLGLATGAYVPAAAATDAIGLVVESALVAESVEAGRVAAPLRAPRKAARQQVAHPAPRLDEVLEPATRHPANRSRDVLLTRYLYLRNSVFLC